MNRKNKRNKVSNQLQFQSLKKKALEVIKTKRNNRK